MVQYEGSKAIYTDLGNDPTDVLNRFKAEEAKHNARLTAVAAGVEVAPEDGTRKTLRQYAKDFLEMHKSLPHRSGDSLRVYTQITTSFLASCKTAYPVD